MVRKLVERAREEAAAQKEAGANSVSAIRAAMAAEVERILSASDKTEAPEEMLGMNVPTNAANGSESPPPSGLLTGIHRVLETPDPELTERAAARRSLVLARESLLAELAAIGEQGKEHAVNVALAAVEDALEGLDQPSSDEAA